MPGRKHSSGPPQRGQWLRRDEGPRSRPWALTEQLFGPTPAQDDPQPSSLAELERRLHDQAERIAELESRVALLPREEQAASNGGPQVPRRTVALRREKDSREFWLAHCEGFLVDSPTGPVGVVESVRFGSRLDMPDEVEIRAGRLRALELVVPVAEIDAVDPEHERIRLVCDPRVARRQGRVHALLPRARRRFDSFVSFR
jgi:hypothetical protein